MEGSVAGAVLAAALLHASWHALVKASGERVIALAGMSLVSASAALAAAPFVRLPSGTVLTVIALSVGLHAAYKVALARLYTRSDLSQAYPLARGLTPICAMLLALAFLGEVPSAATIAGVLAISLGIAGLVFEPGAQGTSAASVFAAAVVSFSVAAYSALDAYGVRLNGDWLGFTVWLVIADSAVFAAYALATRRGAALAQWRRSWGRTLLSGLFGLVSFGVFMWALGRAQVSAVTALRETSILFAALIGAAVLREPMTRGRAVSTLLVAGGTAAIATA
jgi:drug/metabolite transporter (DMT)-like permease